MEVKEIDSFITAYQLRDIAQSLTNIASKNWFWDIVVPIGIAALVAVISSILTYFYTRRANNALLNQQQAHFNQNQLIARENSKRESINEFNLLVNSCLTTLICIKDQYRRPLPNLLLQRILHIPVIKSMKFEDIEYKELLSKLTFITPVGEEKVTKWNQVTQIEGLLYNYNSLMNMWFERNKIRQEFQDLLIASPVRNKDIIYLDDIHGLIPTELTQGLIQITEKCISLTDDLCSEFNNFLSNFNDSVEAKLNKTIKSQFLVNLYTFPKELNSNRLEIINREIEPQWTELLPYFRSLSDYELFVESMCSVYTPKQTISSKPVSFSPFSPSFHAISEPNVIETTFSLRL